MCVYFSVILISHHYTFCVYRVLNNHLFSVHSYQYLSSVRDRIHLRIDYFFTRLVYILIQHVSARILRLPCKNTANFQKSANNITLNGGILIEFTFQSMYKCAKDCLMNRKCKTISIHATKKRCKLHDRNSTDPGMALVPADGWVLYQTNWDHKRVDDFVCTFTVYEKYFQAKVHISIFVLHSLIYF